MIFKPPMNVAKRDRNKKSVFLAGSIEMGKAEDWQARVGNLFLEQNYNVFNPKREDWDASWIQSFLYIYCCLFFSRHSFRAWK